MAGRGENGGDQDEEQEKEEAGNLPAASRAIPTSAQEGGIAQVERGRGAGGVAEGGAAPHGIAREDLAHFKPHQAEVLC